MTLPVAAGGDREAATVPDLVPTADTSPPVDWGGGTWRRQVERGLAWLGPVDGLRVLELGPREGRMATWFAEQGAIVAAYDIRPEPLEEARRWAAGRGVGDRTTFSTYSGDLAELPDHFDVVFTKSTVVVMDQVAAPVGLAGRLVPGGRLLMVENAAGSVPVRLARMVRRRSRRPFGAAYFVPGALDPFRQHFELELEHWTPWPPTVVVGARTSG
ncbi:MAG: class I SAM-dependent methyltransferase [Ilumatobacteraceae bacterium]